MFRTDKSSDVNCRKQEKMLLTLIGIKWDRLVPDVRSGNRSSSSTFRWQPSASAWSSNVYEIPFESLSIKWDLKNLFIKRIIVFFFLSKWNRWKMSSHTRCTCHFYWFILTVFTWFCLSKFHQKRKFISTSRFSQWNRTTFCFHRKLIINCKPMNFATSLELKNVIRTKI